MEAILELPIMHYRAFVSLAFYKHNMPIRRLVCICQYITQTTIGEMC